MTIQILKQSQRDFLSNFGKSDEELNLIEQNIRRSAKIYRSWQIVLALAAIVLVILPLIIYSDDPNKHSLFIALGILYVGYYTSIFIVQLSNSEYLTFSALVKCTSVIEAVMHSVPASRERRKLGAQLLKCANRMRTYSPWIFFRLHKKIIDKEAKRGGQVLRALVYPAMLGTDDELCQIKEIIARAALKVGAGNWIQVKELDTKIENYPVPRPTSSWASLQTFLPLAGTLLVPLAGLIVYLIQHL